VHTSVVRVLDNSKAQPKATIIFRGTGSRIKREETMQYDERVHVLWQKNAWADTTNCIR
jgi:hypothetical protein